MYFLKKYLKIFLIFKKTYKIRNCSTKIHIESGYQPRNVEKRQEVNALRTLKNAENKVFSMILPPPNVTGHIHLGHCLTATVQDVIARHRRKCGFNVEWIPGMDHAGIATQIVVEKYLQKQRNITRHDLGRHKFINEVQNWKDQRSDRTKRDLLKLGTTLDWQKEYFTMDDSHSYAVREAFIRLFNKGLIYRRKSLVNWSCTLESTISDIEIDLLDIDGPTEICVPGYDKKVKFGQIYDIVYKTTTDEEIIVSTTRPETILGDVAVAVNPRDSRYRSFLENKNCKLVNPFRMETIPIIADESIDMDFGSGAVKITPVHDKNDFAIGQRHALPLIPIMNEKGNICEKFESFAGVPRFIARDMILNVLMDRGLLKDVKPHKMALPICSRSKDIIEFQLRSQWFVRCKQMSERAREAVESKKIKIFPKTFIRDWEHWLNGIHDWCISRQLWWGHQIPAYLFENTWVAAHSKEEVLSKLKEENVDLDLIKQDEDVLDTWFSSALLPFSLHGWPKKKLNELYPLDVMETGHDILFFWVARMAMLGIELTDTIPFKEILLHGIVCDAFGRKMSKSLGNIITPHQIINGSSLEELQQETKTLLNTGVLSNHEYEKSLAGQAKMFPEGIPECGTDALRFTLCSHNIKTHFINFDIKEVYANKLFFNKIWNATRYTIKMNEKFLTNMVPISIDNLQHERLSQMDKWILSRLSETSSKVYDACSSYNFHYATMALKNFFRNDLCDTYLETTKRNKNTINKNLQAKVNCLVLNICLAHGLELMEIFTPFLTLDLKAHLPQYKINCLNLFKNPSLEIEVSQILNVCFAIRQMNSQHKITKQLRPTLFIHPNDALTENLLKLYKDEIECLSFCENVHFLEDNNFAKQKCKIKSVAGSICSFGVSLNQDTQLNEKSKEINFKKTQKLEKELNKIMKIVSNTGYANAVSDDVKNKMNQKIMKLKMEIENIKAIQ